MAKINEEITDQIFVMDTNGDGVTGLVSGDFNVNIYKNNVITTIASTITEVSNGYYLLTFTPIESGNYEWYVYQATYQPQGWFNNTIVRNSSIDDNNSLLQRTLGLSQENSYLYDTVYDASGNLTSGKISLHDSAVNVGTANGIIAEYIMTSTYDSNGRLLTYKMVKQ